MNNIQIRYHKYKLRNIYIYIMIADLHLLNIFKNDEIGHISKIFEFISIYIYTYLQIVLFKIIKLNKNINIIYIS